MLLRCELHPYTQAIREAGERIGAVMERERCRFRWPWEIGTPAAFTLELAAAWHAYGDACEKLHEFLTARGVA